MNSTASLHSYPAGRPLTADQITEFHAARLILLIHLCGTKDKVTGRPKIEGLTKLAKLDFFVRYPSFFQFAKAHVKSENVVNTTSNIVDSEMVRHHYGPWDPRYYQLLAYLESRELITVEKQNQAFVFSLTEIGLELAKLFVNEKSFQGLCDQMLEVKKLFGSKSGDALKKMVYSLFDQQIAKLPLGQVI